MKRFIWLVMAAMTLSACDSSPTDKMITCLDHGRNAAIGAAVDITHFPAYVVVNGKRLYPDETLAVDDMGSVTIYSFSKTKSDNNGYFVSDEMQLQKSNHVWADAVYALKSGEFKQAAMLWKEGLKWGTYSHVELSYGTPLVSNQISGACEQE